MYKLIIEDDEGKTTVVPLIRDEITIGRKEGNTIRLTERNVSRRHARLTKQNGSVFIEDLSSYNGIKVNGGKIGNSTPIGEGDRVQIGDYSLALKLERPAPPQDSTAVADQVTRKVGIADISGGAVPTTQIDSIPTIKNPILVTAPMNAHIARLVAVSTTFVGQEFALDRAAAVIGRTEDNDIVLDHRSISRHHAKIVRDNNRYYIVDLQSANGVRVNGEPYGRVELRAGDNIDLGYIRLRFVGENEDFVFERDAEIVDMQKGRRRAVAFLLIGFLAILAGGGYYYFNRMGGSTRSPAAPQDPEMQLAKLLLDSDKAMRAEDWDGALAKLNEALRVDPTQELAKERKAQAERERATQGTYKQFIAATERNDIEAALSLFHQLDDKTSYHTRAAPRFEQLKANYISTHLETARHAKQLNRCDDVRQEAEAVLAVEEGQAEAQELARSCGQTAKVAARPKDVPRAAPRSPDAKPIAKSKEPDATEPSEGPNPQIEKRLQDAQDAYVHGQYATAIELARGAVKAVPNKAWRIIGASHCFLKDRNNAMLVWNKLDGQGKQFLKYVCSRNQVTIP